jgi:hypothetical protein
MLGFSHKEQKALAFTMHNKLMCFINVRVLIIESTSLNQVEKAEVFFHNIKFSCQ